MRTPQTKTQCRGMPQLEFRIPGLEQGVTLKAKLEVQYNRGNSTRTPINQAEDRVRIPSTGAYTQITGDTWQIWRSYQTVSFFGGDATLTFRLMKNTDEVIPPQTINFRIEGKNPDDVRCKKYIQAQPDVGPTGNLWFAYAIAKHETKAQNRENLYYNQFYELLPHIGRPVFGDDRNPDGTPRGPGGYGIYQVTVTNIPRKQIWNWQINVDAGLEILDNKRTVANDWMTEQRIQAGSTDLPSHTVSGVQFAEGTYRTMEDAVTMKAYNGASRAMTSFEDPGDPDDFPGFRLDPHYRGHYCYWKNATNEWALSRYNVHDRNYVYLVCQEVEP